MPTKSEIENFIPSELVEPVSRLISYFGTTLSESAVAGISGLLPDFETQNKKTAYELEAIKKQLAISATNTELLENTNETCRMLGDQFYDERLIQPMVRSLFPAVDHIDAAQDKLEEDEATHRSALQYLEAIRAQLEQFFAGYGIEIFRHQTEETFDPKVMKPLKIIFTNDPELNDLVAESLQCGFRMGERITRLETISLFKYEEASI